MIDVKEQTLSSPPAEAASENIRSHENRVLHILIFLTILFLNFYMLWSRQQSSLWSVASLRDAFTYSVFPILLADFLLLIRVFVEIQSSQSRKLFNPWIPSDLSWNAIFFVLFLWQIFSVFSPSWLSYCIDFWKEILKV